MNAITKVWGIGNVPDLLIFTDVHNIFENPHHNPILIPLIINNKIKGSNGRFAISTTLTTFIIAPKCFNFFSLLNISTNNIIAPIPHNTIIDILNALLDTSYFCY